jgi:hypothetical protein
MDAIAAKIKLDGAQPLVQPLVKPLDRVLA